MKCEICGKECESNIGFGGHIKQVHKINTKDYYDSYLKQKDEGMCTCGKETKFVNVVVGYRKHCSLKCAHNDEESKIKRRKTNLERYGTENVLSSEKIRNKLHQTMLEKYGSTEIFSTTHFKEKHKKNSIKKYKVAHPMQNKDVYAKNAKSRKHYKYNDVYFDSSWELAFWVYCLDNNIKIEREPLKIKYIDENNKQHYYYPDFRINNLQIIEIKGDQYLDIDGKLLDKSKQKCIEENNIEIWNYNKVKPYLDYCENKFQDTRWYVVYYNKESKAEHKPSKHKSKDLIKPIECKICHKIFQNGNYLSAHLKFEEYITSKEYYDIYLKKPNEGFCEVCHKPTNYIGLERGYQVCCSRQCAAKEKGIKISTTKQSKRR